ncbi:MAG: signal peptidase I [Thermoleophilia bacterium]
MSPDADTRSTEKQSRPRSHTRTLLEYVVLALIAFAVALLVQAFLIKPYRIPSESMQNTLLIGDRVLVDRISWRFTEPERGDIVVFHPPEGGPVLIKRIVGMPGDKLATRDGKLLVNGQPLDEPYVRTTSAGPEPTDPFLNGLAWSLEVPYVVPDGEYYMMGDNRTNSADSRRFGPVARDQLVGKAVARYWPIGRIGGLD